MLQTDENIARAKRFERLAKIHDALTDETYEETGPTTHLLANMLADMRHFCDAFGIDYAEVSRMAQEHYLDEVQSAPASTTEAG